MSTSPLPPARPQRPSNASSGGTLTSADSKQVELALSSVVPGTTYPTSNGNDRDSKSEQQPLMAMAGGGVAPAASTRREGSMLFGGKVRGVGPDGGAPASPVLGGNAIDFPPLFSEWKLSGSNATAILGGGGVTIDLRKAADQKAAAIAAQPVISFMSPQARKTFVDIGEAEPPRNKKGHFETNRAAVTNLLLSESLAAASSLKQTLRANALSMSLTDACTGLLDRENGETIVASLPFDRVLVNTQNGGAVWDFVGSDWAGQLFLTQKRALIICHMSGLRHELLQNMDADPKTLTRHEITSLAVRGLSVYPLRYDWRTRFTLCSLAAAAQYRTIVAPIEGIKPKEVVVARVEPVPVKPAEPLPPGELEWCDFCKCYCKNCWCCLFPECPKPTTPLCCIGKPCVADFCDCYCLYCCACCAGVIVREMPNQPEAPKVEQPKVEVPVAPDQPGPRQWQSGGPPSDSLSADHVLELGHFFHSLFDEPCSLRMYVPGTVTIQQVYKFLGATPAIFEKAPPIPLPPLGREKLDENKAHKVVAYAPPAVAAAAPAAGGGKIEFPKEGEDGLPTAAQMFRNAVAGARGNSSSVTGGGMPFGWGFGSSNK